MRLPTGLRIRHVAEAKALLKQILKVTAGSLGLRLELKGLGCRGMGCRVYMVKGLGFVALFIRFRAQCLGLTGFGPPASGAQGCKGFRASGSCGLGTDASGVVRVRKHGPLLVGSMLETDSWKA